MRAPKTRGAQPGATATLIGTALRDDAGHHFTVIDSLPIGERFVLNLRADDGGEAFAVVDPICEDAAESTVGVFVGPAVQTMAQRLAAFILAGGRPSGSVTGQMNLLAAAVLAAEMASNPTAPAEGSSVEPTASLHEARP